MNRTSQFEAAVIADFTDALEAIPGVRKVEMRLNGRDGETEYDGLADVRVRQKSYTLRPWNSSFRRRSKPSRKSAI
ncbi:hypothetical protein [Asticcacaulis excentricus]|uniref:hypothetical protein n=1 Tax=Asticcacaulis excentricus TaxID=78587 RepID=UPI0002FCE78B|nr:hypothetical protein [Asticcacaulis excentricus]